MKTQLFCCLFVCLFVELIEELAGTRNLKICYVGVKYVGVH